MNILHLEDDEADAELTRLVLARHWPESTVTRVASAKAYNAALAGGLFDLILADFDVRGFDGRASFGIARKCCPNTPFVFLSGTIEEEQAFDLLREGVSDYVSKDRLQRLVTVIPRVLREAEERRRRLQAETELRQSEERFRSIFLNLTEGVVLLDNNGLIVSANPSATRILRTSDLVGRSGVSGWNAVREDLSPLRVEDLPTTMALRNGLAQRDVIFGVQQVDGAVIWINADVQPLYCGEKKAVSGAVVAFNDITEKKRLQEQYFRAQRMESLGMLAAGIAHDMNNVLSPVLMGAPLVKERCPSAEDRKILDTIITSAERGADLVKQILGFTKGAGGEQRLIQVKHLVKDLQSLLEASLPKSINVEVELAADLWLTMANPSQLHQVLLNLCVNARDAMPKGGTLCIEAKNHRLDLKSALARRVLPPGPYLLMEVRDTGTGIPKELLERIWEPFFSTKGEDKGTGLGLATVRGIIEAHHGQIEVETELRRGTAFRILLPAIAQPQIAETEKSTHPFPGDRGNGELVLVVDDEEEIRALATTLLTERGYRVIGATNGMQAYSQLIQRGETIRLLLTDLNMPELDGAGLAMITRRQFPGINILAVSGRSSCSGLSTNYVQYIDGFLQKPFKPRVLFETVHNLLHVGTVHPGSR